MMNVAGLQDSHITRVPLTSFESSVAFANSCQLNDEYALERMLITSESRTQNQFDGIVGKSDALGRVLDDVETVAPAESTVMIYGETGTGKELIARAVHNLSPRRSGSFIKFNCSAIPTGLLESELFGHEKGAFTGAVTQRLGRFEMANGGTIFLDEIGEIPLEVQPILLRVLQEREFERLGGTRTIHANVRLIAATNRDLKSMVQDKKFRSDLYYRLNVFPINVPALRERSEDIPLLVHHFVQEFSRKNGRPVPSIPQLTMERLIRYPWPGNVREVQNVLERAVLLSKGTVLTVALDDFTPCMETKSTARGHESLDDLLHEEERTQILRALEMANGVIAGPKGAAARLKIKRSTLVSRMQKLGIRMSRSSSCV